MQQNSIKIGLCCSANAAAQAKAAGCEYVELSFTNVARMSDAEFAEAKGALIETGLRAEAMNSFIPEDFSLCTMQLDEKSKKYLRLNAFLEQGFGRAKELGTEIVVFGSAGARRLPEGVKKNEGWKRLIPWCRLAGEVAEKAGMTIAVEPLCYAECNAINTLREGLAFMRMVGHDHVKLLADMYHMGENGEAFDNILLPGNDLRHCHIGRPDGRTYPLPGDGYDYRPFFTALRNSGYTGRLSIEAIPRDGPQDLPAAVDYLKCFILNA